MSMAHVGIAVFVALFLLCLAAVLVAGDRFSHRQRRVRERLQHIRAGLEPESTEDLVLIRNRSHSRIPPLDRILSAVNLATHLQARLEQAGLTTNSGTLILGSLCLAGVAWLVVSFFSSFILVALGSAVGALFIPYALVMRKRRRRLDRFDALLPEAIDLVANALKAGFSLEASLELAAKEVPDPLGGEFATASKEQSLGVDMTQALWSMCVRVPTSHDLKIMTTAIAIQKRTGGNLTEVLSHIAVVVRERFSLRRDIQIFTAQGRLSGVVLALLPLVTLVIMSLVNHDHARMFFLDPQGRILMLVALAMQVVGFLTIYRITGVRV
jgi:tight adherence protein B